MPIRLLLPEVSSKIAAGEVIERPASVVKELLENSLDAGATEIAVEIKGGGVDYIRIADNGSGIVSEDVELAFQRFATSKVSQVQDLESISTLGFRGEALPSIAAVAGVSLVTRSATEEFGTRMDVVEGRVVQKEAQGAPLGTALTVRHLFDQLPARRKFLRSPATETSRIQVLVTRYALAYPEVKFKLSLESSKGFASSGSGDIREAIASVYGVAAAEPMLELSPGLDAQNDAPVIWGMISPPSVGRARRNYMSFFVNRRWVQNRMLVYALEQAYHGFIAERRYPVAVVNLSLPHHEVDVNVHPAKSEVRFHRENQVFAGLQQAARRTLTAHSPVPEMSRVHATHPGPRQRQHATTFWPVEPFTAPGDPLSSNAHPAIPSGLAQRSYPDVPTPKKALPVLRVLGQVQNTYIAAEGPDGMYLIDQHAAHERVVFERVRAEAEVLKSNAQSLLEPATVELNQGLQQLLEAQQELITGLGFHVEAFGSQTYLLRAVPSLLTDDDPGGAFLDVLDLMAEGGGFESWSERAAYSIACHGAIRAGKSLSFQEMTELAHQLEDCQQPNTCPHGRPTMIHLSASHLEREFGRR